MGDVITNPTISLQRNIGTPHIYYLADGRAIFICVGNPNGVIAANAGSLAIDKNTGIIYTKLTDSPSGNPVSTGWVTGAASSVQRGFSSSSGFGNSGGAETTISSVTIPANTILANGDAFRIKGSLETAANANGKQFRFYFPTSTIFFDTGSLAFNNKDCVYEYTIQRIDSSNARVFGSFMAEATGGVSFFVNHISNIISGIDWTIANQFRITGQSAAAASNDLTAVTLQAFLEKISSTWTS